MFNELKESVVFKQHNMVRMLDAGFNNLGITYVPKQRPLRKCRFPNCGSSLANHNTGTTCFRHPMTEEMRYHCTEELASDLKVIAERVIGVVAQHFAVEAAELTKHNSGRKYASEVYVVMSLLKEFGLTDEETADLLARMPASIPSALRRFNKRLKSDLKFKADIASIKRKLQMV